MSASELWIVPSLSGTPTGGTLYNARLIAARRALGARCRVTDLAGALGAMAGDVQRCWVDSLYLSAMPRLRMACRSDQQLWLVLHYLPSLITPGASAGAGDLRGAEVAALERVDGVLVTGAFMERQIIELARHTRVLRVEPAAEVAVAVPHVAQAVAQVLMIANLTPAKGVGDFVGALAHQVKTRDSFVLTVVGSNELDPEHARTCVSLVEAAPALHQRVIFAGSLRHAEVMERLRHSALLVSASRMESYGMALAEARAAGVPILACTGGNTSVHVAEDAGGALVDNPEAVASAMLALVRDGPGLEARGGLARAARRARSWQDVARELDRIS